LWREEEEEESPFSLGYGLFFSSSSPLRQLKVSTAYIEGRLPLGIKLTSA
jgi:phosphoribosyl-dephospho-CoA transferase